MTRHKHAEIINAWANGETVQQFDNDKQQWYDCNPTVAPLFAPTVQYRIKSKPDVVRYVWATEKMGGGEVCFTEANGPNLKLVFDAETGKLKDAELL